MTWARQKGLRWKRIRRRCRRRAFGDKHQLHRAGLADAGFQSLGQRLGAVPAEKLLPAAAHQQEPHQSFFHVNDPASPVRQVDARRLSEPAYQVEHCGHGFAACGGAS